MNRITNARKYCLRCEWHSGDISCDGAARIRRHTGLRKHDWSNSILRFIAAALMVISLGAIAAKNDRHITVFGDSLSAPAHSWANQIDDMGYVNIRNHAQSGLTMLMMDMPDHLACHTLSDGTKHDEVVLMLGTNDIIQGIHVRSVEQSLVDKLQFLEGRRCKVYLVLPPRRLTGLSAEHMKQYRRAYRVVARKYSNVTVLDIPYDLNQLEDLVHPNEYQHGVIADYMLEAINI